MYFVVCSEVSNSWPLSELLRSTYLSVLYWAMSVNIKDYANTLVFSSFMQSYWHHTISHLCKCYLVASYLLNHCYSVNSSTTRLWYHGCSWYHPGKLYALVDNHAKWVSRNWSPTYLALKIKSYHYDGQCFANQLTDFEKWSPVLYITTQGQKAHYFNDKQSRNSRLSN